MANGADGINKEVVMKRIILSLLTLATLTLILTISAKASVIVQTSGTKTVTKDTTTGCLWYYNLKDLNNKT